MSIYLSVKSIIEEKPGKASKGALPLLLKGLSVPYCVGVTGRNFLYRRGLLKTRRLPAPVISVGNITVGGTGKTPIVIMIGEILLKMGIRPAILSRGYRGKARGKVNIVSDDREILLGRRSSGDEPFMMSKRLKGVPVITGKDRFASGIQAIKEFDVDAFILDDGFQHIGLYRDLNILLIDDNNPLGNGYLLPRGMLRELPSAMERADLIILTKCKGNKINVKTTSPAKDVPICTAGTSITGVVDINTEEEYSANSLRNRRVMGFCGICSPEAFLNTLEMAGCNLVGFHSFPDHHEYSDEDILRIMAEAGEKGAEFIITTEKDAVRIPSKICSDLPIRFITIDVSIITGRNYLEKKIKTLFNPSSTFLGRSKY